MKGYSNHSINVSNTSPMISQIISQAVCEMLLLSVQDNKGKSITHFILYKKHEAQIGPRLRNM